MTDRLIEAGVPAGATVTHIFVAKLWRLADERMGAGYCRRKRIRARKRRREPFIYEHRALLFVPHSIVLSSGGGRTA